MKIRSRRFGGGEARLPCSFCPRNSAPVPALPSGVACGACPSALMVAACRSQALSFRSLAALLATPKRLLTVLKWLPRLACSFSSREQRAARYSTPLSKTKQKTHPSGCVFLCLNLNARPYEMYLLHRFLFFAYYVCGVIICEEENQGKNF